MSTYSSISDQKLMCRQSSKICSNKAVALEIIEPSAPRTLLPRQADNLSKKSSRDLLRQAVASEIIARPPLAPLCPARPMNHRTNHQKSCSRNHCTSIPRTLLLCDAYKPSSKLSEICSAKAVVLDIIELPCLAYFCSAMPMLPSSKLSD